jgi:hypothetical protein
VIIDKGMLVRFVWNHPTQPFRWVAHRPKQKAITLRNIVWSATGKEAQG